VQLIKDMVAAGFADRITLGTDSGKRSYQKAYGAGSGIDYDLTITKPRLVEEGLDPHDGRGLLRRQPCARPVVPAPSRIAAHTRQPTRPPEPSQPPARADDRLDLN
jgi:hypothetical protein